MAKNSQDAINDFDEITPATEVEISEQPDMEMDESDTTKLEAELVNVRQQLLRAHADFDNFRKRARNEKEDLQRFATKKLLGELLPVADNFERAMVSLAGDERIDEVKIGLDMVYRQLVQVFQQNGVETMEPIGQLFNPALHDAVMQEPADGRDIGIVTQVLQTGYLLHDKVLRPAMVKVTN